MRGLGLVGLSLLGCVAVGCEDEPAEEPFRAPAAGKSARAAAKQAAQAAESKEVASVTFTDDDFVESESNRDPFRGFADAFEVKVPAAPQRLVLMPEVSVNQMRLIAVVTGTPKPRAMLVDPKGVGHVAARGDFIGRAEVVQTGGRESLPVTLNWRVDRIRASEVVLAREDPSSPNRVPLTRVLSLHDQDALETGIEGAESSEDDVPEFDGDSSGG